MAYQELIKNFGRIRDYMREFYVYGFKSREDYKQKSVRSYDDERRRMESWLGDYMGFRQTQDGKSLFLSIDSRTCPHNPLYGAWKARSFTDGDITLHFILFDLLSSPDIKLSLHEILEKIDGYLHSFQNPRVFDASTVRKKLNEYEKEGLVCTERRGKLVFYSRAKMQELPGLDALDFFSEVAPCGVIGSFLLDKAHPHKAHIAFKHHYITQALDSDILCILFDTIHQKQMAQIHTINRRTGNRSVHFVVPLRIFVSVQNGRQYLLAYHQTSKRIRPFRLDNILSVQAERVCANYDELRKTLARMQNFMWGVSTQGESGRLEHVEFTVEYAPGEEHIHHRLEREKRCGQVERIDPYHSRFFADVYDTSELVPWIRTFLCRITRLQFSNKRLEEQFKHDLYAMYRLYDVQGGGQP